MPLSVVEVQPFDVVTTATMEGKVTDLEIKEVEFTPDGTRFMVVDDKGVPASVVLYQSRAVAEQALIIIRDQLSEAARAEASPAPQYRWEARPPYGVLVLRLSDNHCMAAIQIDDRLTPDVAKTFADVLVRRLNDGRE